MLNFYNYYYLLTPPYGLNQKQIKNNNPKAELLLKLKSLDDRSVKRDFLRLQLLLIRLNIEGLVLEFKKNYRHIKGRVTVVRSPHVFKKHSEQFGSVIYVVYVKVNHPNPKIVGYVNYFLLKHFNLKHTKLSTRTRFLF